MQTEQPGVWQIGEWRVDPALDTITRGEEIQKLEPRTMRLLLCLAHSAGTVVSVDTLLTEVWSGVVVGSASVYQAISQLRKLLGDVEDVPTYIANVPRKGYRLIAPARRIDTEPAARVADSAIDAPREVAPGAPRRIVRALAIAATVIVVMIAVGLVAWNRHRTVTASAGEAASIVVLPFVDMTSDKADQAFCDGMTEELSSWLAQIPALRVVARTSAFAFRGKDQDVRVIGKALATNHILEGSLRRSGNHARITVQLIDARNGYHMWSETFDIPIEDAIKVQEDISRSVAHTLQIRLTPDAEKQFANRRTANGQAYEWFLLGRHYAQQLSPESTGRAIDSFQKVVAADPKFAPGYTQLAYALLNQWYFEDLPIAEVAGKIEPLIAAALALDSRFSSAYAVRGALRNSQSRTDEGLADLKIATALNPSDLGALAEIGRVRLGQARPREGLKSYDMAAALDPLNYTLQEQRCVELGDLGRYEEAGQACNRARELEPGTSSPADHWTWLAEAQGKTDAALHWNAESLKTSTSDDFTYYWTRSDLLLSLALTREARAAIDSGRSATKDDDNAKIALVRVVYCEGGVNALRSYLQGARLDQSVHANALFEAAYGALLLGDAAAVKRLIAKAVVAPDRAPGYAEEAWYARGIRAEMAPFQLNVAAADLALGDRDSAQRELERFVSMLDAMIAAGVERHATYQYRAQAYAMLGRGDEAMRDLAAAAKLGWRRVWWATHEPYFASLRQRGDFRALMDNVQRANEPLAAKISGAGGL